jgi:predicted phosphodiesterase
MKVAVISDIHGNIYALEEVLKSATKEKVEKLLVLGDVVGYYYHPDKVLKLLDDWDYELIRGNHEDILLDMISHKIPEIDIRMKYGSGHRFALEKLSNNQIEKITTLLQPGESQSII